jgi:hypothetical protein
LRRGLEVTSKGPNKRLFEESYHIHSKRLMALRGVELITWGRHPARRIYRCCRANLRTIGRLCPLRSEGRKELCVQVVSDVVLG